MIPTLTIRMKTKLLLPLFAILGLGSAQAHRAWVLPSSTILSGDKTWVTFDACVSNNIFFANHRALPVESLSAFGPDGSVLKLENAMAGNLRSTFDVELAKEGTYQVGIVRSGITAMWFEGETRKRWQGTREELIREGITKKPKVRISDGSSAIMTYVTLGKPSREILAPKNKGLEIVFPEVHPNDLVTNAPLKLAFLLDGKPASDLEVVIIKDGDRHRDDAGEIKVTTDAKGEASVTLPDAGFYWLESEFEGEGDVIEDVKVAKRFSLSITLEVLPE